MKAHNVEAIGFLKLHFTPTEPNHAVRKEDLDALKNETSARPVFVTGVEPQESGNVGNKQYANTTPANQILIGCVSDTEFLRIRFYAESRIAFSAPEIEVRMGENVLDLPIVVEAVEGSSNQFRGHIDIEMTQSGTITLISSEGTSASVNIIVDALGPVIESVVIDALPEGQSRVKEGDLVQVSGVVDNTAVSIEVVDNGAATSGEFIVGSANSAGPGLRTFTGHVEISSGTGLMPIRLAGRNQLGTIGAHRDSSNVRLDQIPPSVILIFGDTSNGKPYLGLNDTVDVTLQLNNVDTMEFDFLYGDEGGPKTSNLPTRKLTVNQEVFNEEGGIIVRATRAVNGTSFEREFDIRIASIPLVLDSLSIDNAVLRENSRLIPSLPLFGEYSGTRLPASEFESLSDTLPSTDNQDFMLMASSGYGYFVYPAALGEATFVDMSTGMVGGFDGATWPENGSVGSTYGPLRVMKDGIEWLVYRTDYPGTVAPFLVTFQNPGLTVGVGDPIPHLRSSPDGETYRVRLEFNQSVFEAPTLELGEGSWVSEWQQEEPHVWVRTLLVSNSDARGPTSFSGFRAESGSGKTISSLNGKADYVIAGFTRRVVTFPALSRLAPIGVRVYNVTRTKARYAGADSELSLRTDTRDARSSYSIVNSEGEYTASMGTHIWLSDGDFAGANTTGTLQVEIEELP